MLNGKFLRVIIFLAAALIFTSPMLANISFWPAPGWHDSDIIISFMHLERESLLQYKQFPFWTPNIWGGIELFNITSMVFSPFYLLILLFNEIIGLKLMITVHLFFGLLGMHMLARRMGAGEKSSYLASFIFFLSSIYPLQVAEGTYYSISLAWLPWAFLYFLKSFDDARHAFISSFFCALILFSGGLHPVLFFTFLLFLVYSIFESFKRKDLRAPRRLALISLCTFLLGAVYFFPWAGLFKGLGLVDKYMSYPAYNDLSVFLHSLFSRNQLLSVPRAALSNLPRDVSFWEQRGAYIGVAGLAAYILIIPALIKKRNSFVLTNLLFLAMSVLNIIIPLKILNSLRAIHPLLPCYKFPRLIWMFVFTLSLIAALGLTVFENKPGPGRKARRFFIIAFLLLVFVDLALVSMPVFREAFSRAPEIIRREAEFRQVKTDDVYGASKMYGAVLLNQGVAVDFPKIGYFCNAVSYGSKRYRGEVYLKSGKGEPEIIYFSPNIVKVKVVPEADDQLVLNQNYNRNWKVSGSRDNRVVCVDGLAATRVTPTDAGAVKFYYFPYDFLVGSLVALFTLAAIVLFVMKVIPEKGFKYILFFLFAFSLFFIAYGSIKPVSPEYSYNYPLDCARKGFALLRQGRATQALPFLEDASRYFPNSSCLHEILKKIYTESGQMQKASLEDSALSELYPKGAYSDKDKGYGL